MRAARLIDLVVKDDGVYHNDGSGEYKIDVLYRLHPLELLMDDESDDGYPVGLKLMDLANMHKVILVNPVKAILMQNKAMMAIAHYLAGSTGYFDDAAKQIVRTNIAETSMDAKDFAGRKFLKKPIFGREGCNISIIEPDGTFSYEAEEADDCADIYQEFIDSDLVSVETDAGRWEGKFTYSCFVINGKPSKLFVRFSPYDITGIEALFVPVCVK